MAYEVSLVELTPTVPSPVSAGVVTQPPMPGMIVWQAAQLTAVAPPSGALVHIDGAGQVSGNSVVIHGAGLTLPGRSASVRIGGQRVAVSGTTGPPEETLTVGLPLSLDAGPEADLIVSLAGRDSVPLAFIVDPWLSSVTPIRTALDPGAPDDLDLTLTGRGFGTAPAAVHLQSAAGVTNVTGFAAGGNDRRARITLPAALAGIYQVRLVLSDAASSATNARAFQVIPLVALPVVVAVQAVGGRNVHRLTINGARLNGADLRLTIDGDVFQAGANASPVQIVFTLGRLLDPGAHTLLVTVDGQASRSLAFVV